MRIVHYPGIPDDPGFHDQWNKLVQSMECPQVFYTAEWAQAVAHAFLSSLKPLVVAGYRDDKLAGVVALARDSERVSFLGASTADYCDFVSAPADRSEFIES